MARIGLVAGYGRLPVIFAKAAQKKGDVVIAFALKGSTQEELAKYVDKIHWLEWGDFQKALRLLVTERIRSIVMLGKIKKDILFKGDEKLDERAKRLLDKANDRKDYSILNEVSKVLGAFGVSIIDSTEYLKELIPAKGILTKREPTQEEWDDINYGKDVARNLSRFDIGQTVIVKNKTVIALEAVEGTDQTIERAGGLVNSDFVVIKMARPDQDMRLDVPLAGIDTLKAIVKASGTALALEEGKTFLIDKDEVIKLADEKNISIVIV